MKRFIALLMTMMMVVGLCACDGSKDGSAQGSYPKKMVIGIQNMPNDDAIARQQGLFEKYITEPYGVELEFKMFDSGKDVYTAVAANAIDIGLLGTSPAVIAGSLGLDVEMIWIHEVLGDIEALMVREDLGITTVEELAGKKIATPFGSTAHFSLLSLLTQAGIENDVELLDMSTTNIVAAWERGDIDAAYLWEPQLSNLKEMGGVMLKSSADCAEFGCVTANVEIANTDFSAKYPELVSGYIKAVYEAAEMWRNNPDEAATIVADVLGISKEDAMLQMEGGIWLTKDELLSAEYFGTSDAPGALVGVMKETADFLEAQDSIDAAPDEEFFKTFVNPAYIETLE